MTAKQFLSVFRPDLFNSRVAIITGGATGIGNAITKELLYLGCSVIIASRKEEKLMEAVQELRRVFPEKSDKIAYIPCNIRKEEQVHNLIKKSLELYGKVDYIVNNGGGQFLSPAANITSKGWDAVIETNLKGAFFMCKEVYNQWMEKNGGAIVNILMDFYRGVPMMAHSGAARSGLDNLTKSLAIEWAENGIRVNAVAPGSSIYSETAEKNYGTNIFDQVKPHIPAQRLGTPEEISSAVCFLLSPGASFISGETLSVDCGGRLYGPLFWKIPEHKKLPPFKGANSHSELQSKL